jgi:hypothetical protein
MSDINVNNVHSVYTILPVKDKNAVKIKHVETVKLELHQRVFDTCIDKYDITKNTIGHVYVCNILDKWLMSSKTQPVLYASVLYNRPLGSILLYNIYLYFTVETDVKTREEFLNSKLHGKFSLHVVIDGHHRELDKKIDKFPGNKEMVQMLKDFTRSEEMRELVDTLVEAENEKIKQKYQDDFNNMTVPKPTISLKK